MGSHASKAKELTDFFLACDRGDLSTVRDLAGYLDLRAEQVIPCLENAVRGGYTGLVRWMLQEYGACWKEGYVFLDAILNVDFDMMKTLAEFGFLDMIEPTLVVSHASRCGPQELDWLEQNLHMSIGGMLGSCIPYMALNNNLPGLKWASRNPIADRWIKHNADSVLRAGGLEAEGLKWFFENYEVSDPLIGVAPAVEQGNISGLQWLCETFPSARNTVRDNARTFMKLGASAWDIYQACGVALLPDLDREDGPEIVKKISTRLVGNDLDAALDDTCSFGYLDLSEYLEDLGAKVSVSTIKKCISLGNADGLEWALNHFPDGKELSVTLDPQDLTSHTFSNSRVALWAMGRLDPNLRKIVMVPACKAGNLEVVQDVCERFKLQEDLYNEKCFFAALESGNSELALWISEKVDKKTSKGWLCASNRKFSAQKNTSIEAARACRILALSLQSESDICSS